MNEFVDNDTPESRRSSSKVIIIEGNDQLSKLFDRPQNKPLELYQALLPQLQDNPTWGRYFKKNGISKNPDNQGIRLTTDVTYPYTGALPEESENKTSKVQTVTLEDTIVNLETFGVEKKSKRLWISHRNPNHPIAALDDPNDSNSLGNLKSVTEYAFPKGFEAHQSYGRPDFIQISVYDMRFFRQQGDRMDAYVLKGDFDTLQDAHLASFIITIPK